MTALIWSMVSSGSVLVWMGEKHIFGVIKKNWTGERVVGAREVFAWCQVMRGHGGGRWPGVKRDDECMHHGWNPSMAAMWVWMCLPQQTEGGGRWTTYLYRRGLCMCLVLDGMLFHSGCHFIVPCCRIGNVVPPGLFSGTDPRLCLSLVNICGELETNCHFAAD